MSKVAHYLQEHVQGEVITSVDARRYFSTDASVLTLTPSVIVYPRSESDVRKVTRFTWQLAERGRILSITARGAGTDQAGAALGTGIMLVFPTHLHKIIEFDGRSGMVVVEPGINYGKLQQTLLTHGRFLPPFPASIEYSTIGGALGNNASGEKSVKYGSIREFVRGLRVVLANGEVIETGRLHKRELGKKLGLATFEGEIYRGLDTLIEENSARIQQLARTTTKNAAGYALAEVKLDDGSFDLTPLFVGSQGTLGIVTRAWLDTEVYQPQTTLIVAQFDSITAAASVVSELRTLSAMPSAIEMVDGNLLEVVDASNPNLLKGVLDKPFPAVVLLVEFDDGERQQKRASKKALKIIRKHTDHVQVEQDALQQDKLWRIRHASALVVAHTDGARKAVPIIEDGVVPPERLEEFVAGVYALFKRHGLQVALWGHAGDANLHLQPFFDLAQVGDRQKMLKLMDEYYDLVISLGGSITGEHGDGRLRAPYLARMYGPEVMQLFEQTKKIFDPYGVLNPGVKLGTSIEDVKTMLRTSYTLDHLYNHMPRS